MTKSSEVLLLAAEKALSSHHLSPVLSSAMTAFGIQFQDWNSHKIYEYASICGYSDSYKREETCMVLCMAAAIAGYEGD